jgi:carboxypeptidase C (cathepsin A)
MTEEKKNDIESKKESGPKDNIVSTRHKIRIRGKEISYTATVGTIVLKEEVDKEGHMPKAEMFFVAYVRDGVRNKGKRPLTFSFNGGPGSSSVWMHLGLLGPRRVPISSDDANPAKRLAPPFEVTGNEFTLLEESDLVFIDPIGTGYSRPLSGKDSDPHEFYSFRRDLDSVGEFIRLYTSRHSRWSSPKFLIGESYGTTRASALAGHLQDRYGMYLNGIMLVSVVLNFQTLLFKSGNDLPFTMYLPSYAMTARYHGKLSSALQKMTDDKFLKLVSEFAEGEYNLALMKGSRLSENESRQMAGKLSRFTGLSVEYILGSNLRVPIMQFARELLRKDGYSIGRFDSRIKGVEQNDVSEVFESDPSFDVVQGVYSACLNNYLRSELKFESDLPYEILSFKVLPKWKYDEHENDFVNVAETLRGALKKNPHLQLFIANGRYDLATPFFATEYTLDHMNVRNGADKNIEVAYYDAGHMMYTHKKSLARLSADLLRFVKRTS